MTTKQTLVVSGVTDNVLLGTYNTEVLTEARYVQEVLAGTNADLVVGVDSLPNSGKNLLVNGGFEHWDFGTPIDNTSLSVAVSGPTAWGILGGIATQNASGELSQGSSLSFAAHALGAPNVYQDISVANEIRGHTVTFRVRATGAHVHLVLTDDAGTVVTTGVVDGTDGVWRTLVGSINVSAATVATIRCAVYCAISETMVLESASAVMQPGPVAYVPNNPQVDNLITSQKYMTYFVTARWHTLVASEKIQVYIPFRGAPLPIAPTFGGGTPDVVLFMPSPSSIATDNNIDLTSVVVLDCDVNGMNVQIGGVFASLDTYVIKLRAVVAFKSI